MGYHRLTHLLVAIGGFILGCSSGLLNPLSFVLTVVAVFALAAALAPSKGALLAMSLAMSIGPPFAAIYAVLAALSGGRSDIDPDPMRDLFVGLSMALVVGAVWFHFVQVRSDKSAPGRLVFLCVGLAFVSASVPDLLSEYRQPIGLKYLLIGLLQVAFSAVPNRITVALLVVGFLVGLVGLVERSWILLENPAIVVLQPIAITVLQLTGTLVLYCAVGIQLIKAYVDVNERSPPAQRGVVPILKGS